MSTEKETVQKMLDEAMSEYAALHGHINYLRKKLSLDPLPSLTAGSSQNQGLRPDSFFGHTIGGAAEKYLKIVHEPKTFQEIADALQAGGLDHNSQNLANTVNSVLFRFNKGGKIFVRLPSDQWGLREWYPNLKDSKKNGEEEDEIIDEEEATKTPKGEKTKP